MENYRNNKGMTLMELLLVIAILALFISIVMPKVERRDFHLITCSKMLRDDLRYIRFAKMAEGKNYFISLEEKQYTVKESAKIIKRVKLEKDFKIMHNFSNSGSVNLSFSYKGAPTLGGGTITIFDDKRNRYCEITIVPDTGRILLKDQIFALHSKNR